MAKYWNISDVYNIFFRVHFIINTFELNWYKNYCSSERYVAHWPLVFNIDEHFQTYQLVAIRLFGIIKNELAYTFIRCKCSTCWGSNWIWRTSGSVQKKKVGNSVWLFNERWTGRCNLSFARVTVVRFAFTETISRLLCTSM